MREEMPMRVERAGCPRRGYELFMDRSGKQHGIFILIPRILTKWCRGRDIEREDVVGRLVR
jgi:hypothetical protein